MLVVAIAPVRDLDAQQDTRLGLNSLITLLERDDKPVFVRDEGYRFYEMEHNPYDIAELRRHMLALKAGEAEAVARTGNGLPVIVRIPVEGRDIEKNTWVVKQVLDLGVHGIVFPHIETSEEAMMAIRSMRYPQVQGAPDFEPQGLRSWNPPNAAQLWGLSIAEYTRRADVWRLDPLGELLPVLIIESKLGAQNVRAILKSLKDTNIGALIWVGSGDMAMTYCGVPWCEIGIPRDVADRAGAPKRGGIPPWAVEDYLQAELNIITAGKEFGFPVQINFIEPYTIEERIRQGARLLPGARPANMR